MIILRKFGRQSDCEPVMADEVVGLADGNNQIFAVSYEYTPGKIEIIYNGQVLTSPEDFDTYDSPTVSGLETDEIKFVYLKPTDLTVLKANYLVGSCGGPGTANFIELTDTPTTYSGFESYYLRVNATGDGVEFVESAGDTAAAEEGIESISEGSTSVNVIFDSVITADYVLVVSLENRIDAEPSVYPTLVRNKAATGFTVEFSGDIDSDNYYLHWRATYPGSGTTTSLGGTGLSAGMDYLSTGLGSGIDLGDNLILLDVKPNGMTSHGYEVGYSGDASSMVVFDNPTGFACPLYMRTDGRWGPCTAVSGTIQMPCVALALGEDDGQQNVFWRGNIRKGNWSWTPGDEIYVSTVEGAITNVKPNGGSWPQVIGIAISNDTIRFNPDLSSENSNS